MDDMWNVAPALKEAGLPKGYKRVMWADVYETQVVWLWGTALGEPEAYGPHTIVDKERKKLHSPAGMDFTHYPEELLVKEVGGA
jgi:hypothetical protein